MPNLGSSHIRIYCRSNIRDTKYQYFQFKLFNYIYNETEENFNSISFDIKTTQENIHKIFTKGLSPSDYIYQKNIFGICDLEVKIDSVFSLLLKEVTDPFYIFQVFSVILWYTDDYEKYANVIVITTLVSLIISVYETRMNLVNIKDMAKYSLKVNVFRQNEVKLNL